MKNILLAIDDTKGSVRAAEKSAELLKGRAPERLVLLYVEKLEGRSIMDELIQSDSELATLKEELADTDVQKKLDQRAAKVLDYFDHLLTERGLPPTDRLVRQGHPAEEILAVAHNENIDLIIIGCRGQRLQSLFLGSVSREVTNQSAIPVLVIK